MEILSQLLVISVSKHIFKIASQVMHCSGLLCPAFVAVGHFMTATRPRDGMPRFLKLPATCPALNWDPLRNVSQLMDDLDRNQELPL